jgi:hypothetical protein
MHRVSLAAAALALASGTAAAQSLTPAWTYSTGRITMGTPRIADITGNGIKDVVVATMGFMGNPYNSGWVGAFDIAGNMLPGFPIEISSPIVGPVAIGDLDGDGTIEIVATSWGWLHAWNHDGSVVPGFPRPTGVQAGVPPALADLDGDGRLDIIVAQGPGLYVYDHTGALRPGWPVFAPSGFQAPGVADITGDGSLNIVAGTSAPQFPDQTTHSLYVLNRDGSNAPGFPITGIGSIRGPVSLGDVNQNGQIEIVARSADRLFIWRRDGSIMPGWPVTPPGTGGVGAGPIRNAATAIGDITGDGNLEVVIGGFSMYAYNHLGQPLAGWPVPTGSTGNIRSSAIIADIDPAPGLEIMVRIASNMLGFTSSAAALPWSPYFLSDQNQSTTFDPSPSVDDANGDGLAELVYMNNAGEVHFFHLGTPFEAARAPWPTAQQNIRNTCYLGPVMGPPHCYANCDGSTQHPILNVDDFTCFINEFAAAQVLPHAQQVVHYANCDDSTVAPALNVDDFTCFINYFAAGCP